VLILQVCQNGIINIALFVRISLRPFNLRITLHYFLSVYVLYITCYTHIYSFLAAPLHTAYSLHIPFVRRCFNRHAFLERIMLFLCICSQHLCYHDVPIHWNASIRGWPHDGPKRIVVIQCIYNNFIHLCHLMAFANIPKYCILGCDAVYQCWQIFLLTLSCLFVHCIT
jgi:hypothetical protein